MFWRSESKQQQNSTDTITVQNGGEVDWWPGPGTKLSSLPVPGVAPPGILRTSSPHSSSSHGDSCSGAEAVETERSRSRSYNLRSDTVLEMCSDIEDISFIDEDEDVEEEAIERGEAAESEEKQQIVITLNNEIELTSIVVAAAASSGPQPAQEADKVEAEAAARYSRQVEAGYDEISETSFTLGPDPTTYTETESSASSEDTVSSCGPAPSSVVMKR